MGENRDETSKSRDEIRKSRDGMGQFGPRLLSSDKHSKECKAPVFARFSYRHPRPLVEAISSSRVKRRVQNTENDFPCPTSIGGSLGGNAPRRGSGPLRLLQACYVAAKDFQLYLRGQERYEPESASEGRKLLPRLRFGSVWNASFATARSVNPSFSGHFLRRIPIQWARELSPLYFPWGPD